MPISLGPVRPTISRDPDTASFTPPDRRDAAAAAAKPRSTAPATRSAPKHPDAYGPVENPFARAAAHVASRPAPRATGGAGSSRAQREADASAVSTRTLREGASAQAASPVPLSRAAQQRLAQTYAPVFYLHPNENNEPGNPQTFLDNANVVRDGNKVRLDLPDNMRGGDAKDAPTFYDYDADTRTMTYWSFYPNNDAPGPWFDHEGDWERVEIQFDQKLEPTVARYSNHETHNTYAWDKVGKEQGDRPVVYVAKGTHANSAFTGKHAPPGTPVVGARDEFAKGGTRIDSAQDLHALDSQPWTNRKLEQRFGVDKVLWGETKKSDAGLEARRTPHGPPAFGIDTHYVHGDSPDGPDRPPYAAANVKDLAEDILLIGKEIGSGDDDHARLTALSGELLASKDDPSRRARLIDALAEQDSGAFGSWLKVGIADDLVDDGRITREQRDLIRDSVYRALDQKLISPQILTGATPGGW